MLYFLSGEDTFRLRERERELTDEFVTRFPQAERTIFRLDEEMSDLPAQVRERLSGGLFAVPVILHLREISLLPDDVSVVLEKVLEVTREKRDQLVIVSQTGKVKKSTALLKWLTKKASAETFARFDEKHPQTLAQWGTEYLKHLDRRASIEKEALVALAERVRGSSGLIAQELAKLLAYKNGGNITQEDIELFTNEPIESDAFRALDALVSGRRGEAIVLFRREEKVAVPIQRTLGLCAWQIRRLIEIVDLHGQGVRQAGAIAKVLKSSPYPIQKILPAISRFPIDRLKRGLALLADLDLGIRSGRMEPGVALDLFVWRF